MCTGERGPDISRSFGCRVCDDIHIGDLKCHHSLSPLELGRQLGAGDKWNFVLDLVYSVSTGSLDSLSNHFPIAECIIGIGLLLGHEANKGNS
jgi:hypothetical protein